MKNTKIYGLALILGALGGIITMINHPTGAEVLSQGEKGMHAIQVNVYAHSLAIAATPLVFFGFYGLSRLIGIDRLRIQAALASYLFSAAAVICAAVCSGFGATGLAKLAMKEESQAVRDMMMVVFHYNGALNQGFSKIYVVGSSIAFLLWASYFLKSKGFGKSFGIAGIVIGVASLLTFSAGVLRLDVLGFGIFFFAQSLWMIALGARLFMLKEEDSLI